MNVECIRCGKPVEIGHSPKTRSGKQVYIRKNRAGFHAVGAVCYACIAELEKDV